MRARDQCEREDCGDVVAKCGHSIANVAVPGPPPVVPVHRHPSSVPPELITMLPVVVVPLFGTGRYSVTLVLAVTVTLFAAASYKFTPNPCPTVITGTLMVIA